MSDHAKNLAKSVASGSLHRSLANSSPDLAAGLVYCRTCGRVRRVDSAHCLRHGWPKCCGYTMTLGSAEANQ